MREICEIGGVMFPEYMLRLSDMKKFAFSSHSACNIFGGLRNSVKHTHTHCLAR